jgi:hypothetical protein
VLALREDEVGFATVANHAFAGASWRIGRRLPPGQRPALTEARRLAASARSKPVGARRPAIGNMLAARRRRTAGR